jgi:hypothetical protein
MVGTNYQYQPSEQGSRLIAITQFDRNIFSIIEALDIFPTFS